MVCWLKQFSVFFITAITVHFLEMFLLLVYLIFLFIIYVNFGYRLELGSASTGIRYLLVLYRAEENTIQTAWKWIHSDYDFGMSDRVDWQCRRKSADVAALNSGSGHSTLQYYSHWHFTTHATAPFWHRLSQLSGYKGSRIFEISQWPGLCSLQASSPSSRCSKSTDWLKRYL